MNFITVLTTVGLLIALTVPGYLLQRTGKLPENSVKAISSINTFVAFPCLTIASFAKKTFESRLLVNMGIAAGISFAISIIIFLLAKAVFSFSKEEAAKRACTAASFLSNSGFIGIPLMIIMFPDKPEYVLYAAAMGIPGNILMFALGVYVMSGDKKYIRAKHIFLNPPTAALIIALPVFFTGWQVPSTVLSIVDTAGQMCLPLPMLVIGIRIAQIGLPELFKTGKVYAAAAIKLIVMPLVAFAVLTVLKLVVKLEAELITVICFLCAMPTVGSLSMLAELSGADSATAAKCTLLSTVLCLATLPLIVLII